VGTHRSVGLLYASRATSPLPPPAPPSRNLERSDALYVYETRARRVHVRQMSIISLSRSATRHTRSLARLDSQYAVRCTMAMALFIRSEGQLSPAESRTEILQRDAYLTVN
jgi:hypothetical protein